MVVGAFAQIHRNLGIAAWNVRHNGPAARACYESALAADTSDARILYEFDQLRKKLNESPLERLGFLEARLGKVLERDDCTAELASLYNITGKPEKAFELLMSRRFHPWEGGEGAVLRHYTAALLLLGKDALAQGNPAAALTHFNAAINAPDNLGEASHLLQARADINYWIGSSLKALGRSGEAGEHFLASAAESGDLSEMTITGHGPLSWFRGLSLRELGRGKEATALFTDMLRFASENLEQKAVIDYFATSLPNLLVFDEDLQARRDAENHLLIALSLHGLDRREEAHVQVGKVLAFNQAEARATELADLIRMEQFDMSMI